MSTAIAVAVIGFGAALFIWAMWHFAKATDGWGPLSLFLLLSSCSNQGET
jgi:hypothetical protein